MVVKDCTKDKIEIIEEGLEDGHTIYKVRGKKCKSEFWVYRDPDGVWRPTIGDCCWFERQETYEKAYKKFIKQ